MNPRSLVGMTQGARKRAALRDSISAHPDGRAKTRIPLVRRAMHVAALASLSYYKESIRTETRARYAEARARYRIGERLRPCPWCFGPSDRWNCATRTAQIAPTPPPGPCDGSGVLPARRARP